MTEAFSEWRMPDGTPKGRRAWRAVQGETFVAFYAVGRGRRTRYYVTWGAEGGRSGGEQVESFYGAQQRGLALLMELSNAEPRKRLPWGGDLAALADIYDAYVRLQDNPDLAKAALAVIHARKATP